MSKKLIKEFIIHKGSFEQIKDHIGKNELGFAVDKGLPVPTPEDENKFLVVDAEGNYSLASKQLSRKYIYSTLETFRDAINYDYENLEDSIKYTLSYITNEKTGLKINAKFLEIGSDFYLTEKNVPDYWLVQKEIIVNENETFDPLLFFQEHETKYYEPIKYFTGIALENYEWSEGELVYCIENSTNFIRGSYYYHDGIKVHKVSTKDDVDSMSTELKKNINTKLDKSEFNTFKDNLNSVLENIQPSAIVDVEELVYPVWSGTTVPNSETVEKVYFNTSLSVDEVKNLLIGLNYIEGIMPYPANPLIFNGSSAFIVAAKTDSDIYMIHDAGNDTSIFVTTTGWNSDFNGEIEVNSKVLSEFEGISIGSQNSQLSSLFSTTPFVKGEEPKDDVFYRLKVSTQEGWSGTTVPNSGYIEKVYFNTNLTYDEVEAIFNTLNLEDGDYIPILSDNSSDFIIMIGKLEGAGYAIQGVDIKNESEPLYWASKTIASLYGMNPGWQTFDNPIEINLQVISEVEGMLVDKNDKISQLFSITPFESIEGKPKYELYTYKNGEYKKVLQNGDIFTQESKEIDKTIVLTDISEVGQIEYGNYSLTLTSEEVFQLITLEKNSINVIFDVSSIELFASQGKNFLYTKLYFQSFSIEGLRLYGINNYKKTYNFLFSDGLTATGSTDGVSTVYDLTLEANGIRVYSKNESGSSTNKLLSFAPPSVGGNQLISNGQVYTALQNVKAELEEKTPDITVNTTLSSDTQELENIKVGDTTYEIPQTDFVLRDEVTNPDASYLSELQLGESVWQIPHVNFVLRDEVSENTTQQLKELEINGDKWKVSMSKEEIFEMISEYIDTNFENGDEGSY